MIGAAVLVLLAALPFPSSALAQPPQPEVVDAFYLDLFDRGRSARAEGDDGAIRLLRFACFGMLDAPDQLADCLVELALAHAASDDSEGFDLAVRRIADIERRFGAYTAAKLDPELEASLVAELAVRSPVSLLESVVAWKPAAIRRRAGDLASLEPAARLEELEKLHALEPMEPRWRRELAVLALAAGDRERAIILLTPLTDPEAACTRGTARAAGGDCAGAGIDAAVCGPVAPEALWNTRLTCLMASAAWRAAADLHAQLPPALRASKPYRRMGRDITRNLRRLPVEPPADDGSAEGTLDGSPDPVQSSETLSGDATLAPVEPNEPAIATTTDRSATEVASIPPQTQPASAPPPASLPSAPSASASELSSAAPPSGPTPEAIEAAIDRSRRALLSATTEEAAIATLENIEALRAQVGEHPELLLHLAEIHYRLRRWKDSVAAIQASGMALEDRPIFLFYYAVALFESGERSAAMSALERAWPRIQQTDFVRSYATRILGREPD